MKLTIIFISLLLWTSNTFGFVCTAKYKTNQDPTVISKCYAKMLTHFEEILKQQLAFSYAYHLKTKFNLTYEDHRKYYSRMFTELERVQRLLHKLHYPDPRPAVRCESGGDSS